MQEKGEFLPKTFAAELEEGKKRLELLEDSADDVDDFEKRVFMGQAPLVGYLGIFLEDKETIKFPNFFILGAAEVVVLLPQYITEPILSEDETNSAMNEFKQFAANQGKKDTINVNTTFVELKLVQHWKELIDVIDENSEEIYSNPSTRGLNREDIERILFEFKVGALLTAFAFYLRAEKQGFFKENTIS